ncbi:3-dehydrosphinganine reductase [Marchantia polymorpha subsp. ruderalis]|uniref:3-dehydrosphinganine reductase n=2 Tax=Marchantia polymorpha TaxID=3197 RepID=A0AAF6ALF1_MARPO|nr:hypothetical protein MARPO_0005s0172 [Marchantia polymorpha]BBM97269.1 hypothetical protein Mp_1g04350 [Marchantia polymorpha subsp. ruderalis]PTQ48537.1 hypothetical protein MARPO_0005s0172 [Marchantia polymorpha]PTQ48538.1 hypothetical protein MARPO_0005s0172 [Marchantia polymorpha]BBM97270.1 hypothetical protein Mp_1g04350 [Marchantia polymorpha subsp. ruderalis]|eukprot:PTQ48536.1 hypothetical protein MARPO_0005s0172 [Marchantia polymorpha]
MAWLWALVALAPAFVFLIWCLLSPRPTRISLRSRHVVITGGSSGIGLSMAKLAVLEGSRVSILGRNTDKLTAACQEIVSYPETVQNLADTAEPLAVFGKPQVYGYSADVKDFSSVEKALTEAVEKLGPIDVLICSHGVSTPARFEDTPLDSMYHMLDTNLKGNLHCLKAAIPHMKSRISEGPGCISIVSSQAAQVSLYGYSAYSATKGGLRGLAEGLQQELLEYNIRVSLIFPPDTETPGFVEENKTKHELTVKLSESSGAMESMDVAKAAIHGLKAGQFSITCNFEGLTLSTVTAGMSPQPSLAHALFEICTMGILRIVAFVVLAGWYKTIGEFNRGQRK